MNSDYEKRITEAIEGSGKQVSRIADMLEGIKNDLETVGEFFVDTAVELAKQYMPHIYEQFKDKL